MSVSTAGCLPDPHPTARLYASACYFQVVKLSLEIIGISFFSDLEIHVDVGLETTASGNNQQQESGSILKRPRHWTCPLTLMPLRFPAANLHRWI